MADRSPAAALQGAILLVTPRWRRDGGIAAHVQESAAALARAGAEVHVLAAEATDRVPPGVSLHLQPRLLDAAQPAARRIEALPRSEFAAIHLHQLDDPDIVTALRERGPVLISAHGYTACTSDVYYFRPGQECGRHHGPGCWPNLLLRGCAHTLHLARLPGSYARTTRGVAALRLADMAVSYSSAVDRHLANNGIERRAVLPLFATFEPDHASAPAPAAMPTRPGSAPARLRILFAGRVVPAKGLTVLVRAVARIEAELVVCGDGWQLPAIGRLARRLGIADRVALRGWLAPDALARELSATALVALPSLWPEPFGLVGIEAQLARRPVVASATGGLADWLDDGVSGLLVEPGDVSALAAALQELLADPARREAMGEAGRRSVLGRFTAEHHVAAALAAYERARTAWLAGGGGTAASPA